MRMESSSLSRSFITRWSGGSGCGDFRRVCRGRGNKKGSPGGCLWEVVSSLSDDQAETVWRRRRRTIAAAMVTMSPAAYVPGSGTAEELKAVTDMQNDFVKRRGGPAEKRK